MAQEDMDSFVMVQKLGRVYNHRKESSSNSDMLEGINNLLIYLIIYLGVLTFVWKASGSSFEQQQSNHLPTFKEIQN